MKGSREVSDYEVQLRPFGIVVCFLSSRACTRGCGPAVGADLHLTTGALLLECNKAREG